MRVAHFVQRYPPALGGSEAYFARLSRHLAERGDDVDVWTSNALDLEALWSPRGRCLPPGVTVEDGVTVRRYRLWRMHGRRWLLKPLSLVPVRTWQCLTMPCNPIAPRMWRDAGRGTVDYDVVHASAFPYAWPITCGLRLARRLRIPFLLTPFLHLGDPNDRFDRTRRQYTGPPLRRLLRAADRVFVQTPTERAAVIELGVPAERIVLQGLGVAPNECTGGNREHARASWNVRAGEVVVGHLGNNSIEKGTVDLLRAAELLWRRGVQFTVCLAGPEMPNFRRFFEAFGGAVRVNRLGRLTDEQKRDFYSGIDLFALPSRSDSFGLVLLEAWANGLPNVAYRAGGPADLINDGRDGLLAGCGDVDELAAALRRVIGNARLRETLGAEGRRRVARDFRWEDKLRLVHEVMQETVRDASEKRSCLSEASLAGR
jgi:glycosyltransferase involved in cell wall biosynthesis